MKKKYKTKSILAAKVSKPTVRFKIETSSVKNISILLSILIMILPLIIFVIHTISLNPTVITLRDKARIDSIHFGNFGTDDHNGIIPNTENELHNFFDTIQQNDMIWKPVDYFIKNGKANLPIPVVVSHDDKIKSFLKPTAAKYLTNMVDRVSLQGQWISIASLPVLTLEGRELTGLQEQMDSKIYGYSDVSRGSGTTNMYGLITDNKQIQSNSYNGLRPFNYNYYQAQNLKQRQNGKKWRFNISPSLLFSMLRKTGGARLLQEYRISVPYAFIEDHYSYDGKIKTFGEHGMSMRSAFSRQQLSVQQNSVLQTLTIDDFREMYLFDVFRGDTCSHGMQVYNVVKDVLDKYSVLFALEKIHRIPVNYYANNDNIENGNGIINEIRKKFPGQQKHTSSVEKEHIPANFGKDDVAPVNYIYCSYAKYITPNTDIISSSYGLETDEIFHSLMFGSDVDTTNFLAAAGNENQNVEDYTAKPARTSAEPGALTEPQYTYVKDRQDFGVLLIGSMLQNAHTQGRASNKGNAVQTLGHGSGWQTVADSCLKSTDSGTSLATPEIATMLYIAKAYWRKMGEAIDAKEARKRVILATDLNCSIVGKYASGGILQFNKLIQHGKGYLVTTGDSVINFSDIDSASYIFSNAESVPLLTVENVHDEKSIRGLYLQEDRIYVFKNDTDEHWQEFKNIDKCYISVIIDGSAQKFRKFSDFKSLYKQLVILN